MTPATPQRIIENLSSAVVGQEPTLRLIVTALLAGGHVLLEDVPGVGKTLLAKSLAHSIAGVFRRVQFSPDLMPADITGTNIYNAQGASFRFSPGPIFANVLLADEINRASPRTQASLLEAMEEGWVTVDGESHPLPRPFLVLATQNPVEFQGTFPLPEAQLDRFAMRLSMGYPPPEAERELLAGQWSRSEAVRVTPVVTPEELVAWREQVHDVRVDASLQDYMVRVANETRNHPQIVLGLSPRGNLTWQRLAQAHAFLAGRSYVTPDDLRAVAQPVLAHRLILSGRASHKAKLALLDELLASVPVPV
ncbi:MAG TPA: MoxR family ATPase [Stenomitos sp.]